MAETEIKKDTMENVEETGETMQEQAEQEPEAEVELSFPVQMSASLLYDYLIHHAYTGSSGILGTCFGILGLIAYAKTHFILYLILGIVLILYLPVNLRYRASLQMLQPVMKQPLNYEFSEKGFTVSQGETRQSVRWEQCTKAVSTSLSIVVYTGKNNASVFPRKQLGGQLTDLLAVIAKYMDPKKVKIRY
ncbi:MAG: YcxB family protein [Lachnospiraceae bacterium]|nr:YcxB family protein [Lachnospiraceae bacterium]